MQHWINSQYSVQKNIISSSAPIITDIELTKYGPDYILKAITNNPEDLFDWSVSGSDATLYDNPYSGDATFADTPNIYKAIRFNSAGTYIITVTGSNTTTSDEYAIPKNLR